MRTTLTISALLFFTTILFSQTSDTASNEADRRISVAKEIMLEAGLCAMVTQDSTGKINIRTMQPFPPQEDLSVWFGTNALSRKVQDIQANNNIVLYYAASDVSGYVVLHGKAALINNEIQKQKYWMESWADFYPDRSLYLLIKFIPESLEIVSTKHNITSDSPSWSVPSIRLID